MVDGDDPLYLQFWTKLTTFLRECQVLILPCSTSAVTPSKRRSNITNINVKNEVYKTVIGDVVAHLKPQKFTVLSDL